MSPFRRATVTVLAVAAATALAAPLGRPADDQPTRSRHTRKKGWAERTLASLTLERKAGQVLMPMIRTFHAHLASEPSRKLDALVRDLAVGGVIVSRGDPLETAAILNRLQSMAKVPLLVAADVEAGAGVQFRHGGTVLPTAMAVGATGSSELAHAHGRASGREARALGIHLTFAPVVDVNNNPDNPIINVRSYGEDPALVGRLASAFIRGAREAGLLTTAKHFPGHGDTSLDSHSTLATIPAERARLDAVELSPFRTAIAAGVDAVMVGHLAVPALDAAGGPATVSKPVVTDLLRGEMGFDGLVVSDALDMGAVTEAYDAGEAAVRSLAAGVDVILMSPEPERAAASIVAAVRGGRLPVARLDQAVLRILRIKERLRLNRRRTVSLDKVFTEVGDPAEVARMQEIADRSITLIRNDGGIVPLPAGGRILHVTLSGDPVFEGLQDLPEAELRRRVPAADTALVDPRTGREELAAILARAREADAVLVSAFVRVQAGKGTAALPPELAEFLAGLVGERRPVVVVSFGSPYLLRQVPDAPAYLCAYAPGPLSLLAAMKAVFGEMPVNGRLPVTLPGLYPLGHGLVTNVSGP